VENLSNPPGPKMMIGYQTSKFIPIMEVYHDEITFSNLWVSSSIDKFSCPRTIDYFTYQKPQKDKYYNKEKVINLIDNSLGKHNYFLNNNFISRGHLSARSDHSHIAKQVASYSFYNLMPQWSNFNNINWNRIEDDVKKLVNGGLSIHVITGAFGELILKGDKGSKQIYLDNARKQIPIRKFYYKIVIDKPNKRSLVIVGVNDVEKFLDKDIKKNMYKPCY